jgi:hypothetical protein
MNKPKHIIFLFTFYFITNQTLFCQDSSCPLVKTDQTIFDWYNQPFDSTFNDTTCAWSQGYDHIYFSNHFHSLVHEGYLYNAYPVFIKYHEVEGALIEKINMKTGDLMWQQSFDLRNNDAQEVVAYLTINSKNQLEVGSYRRMGASGNGPFFFGFTRSEIDPCILHVRYYNLESGDLIASHFPNLNEENVHNIFKKTQNLKNIYNHTDTSFIFIAENKKEISLDKIDKRTGISLDRYKTIKGVKELYDTSKYIISQIDKQLFFGQDTLIRLNMVQPVNKEVIDNQATLQVYNSKLELKKEINIQKYFTGVFRRINLAYVDKRYIVLNVIREFSLADTLTYEYIIMDWDGELVQHKKVIHQSLQYNLVQFYPLPEYGEFLIIGKPYGLKVLDFLHLSKIGLFTIKNRVTFPEDRGLIADQFLYKDNDELILRMGFGKFGRHGFTSECTHITAKINPNIFTNTLNPLKVTSLKSYPNPSSGPLTLDIKGITGSAEVRIYDTQGRNVYVHHDVPEGEMHLDLSALPTGSYIYKVYQGSREIGSGQWAKVE